MNALTREQVVRVRISAAGAAGLASCEMTMDARDVLSLCKLALQALDAQEDKCILCGYPRASHQGYRDDGEVCLQYEGPEMALRAKPSSEVER